MTFVKVAQKIAVLLGKFFKKRIRRGAQKVAQMAKNRPIWSHWSLGDLAKSQFSKSQKLRSVIHICTKKNQQQKNYEQKI